MKVNMSENDNISKKRKILFSEEINDIIDSYDSNPFMYKDFQKKNKKNSKKKRNLKLMINNDSTNFPKNVTLPLINETIGSSPNYNYYRIKGNNKKIIKNILGMRINWKETSDEMFQKYDLLISDNSSKIDYDEYSYYISNEIKSTNFFEYHSSLTNKIFLFINLMKYCEKFNKNLFDFFPFSIIIDYSHFTHNEQLSSFKNLFIHLKDFIGKNNNKNKSYSELFFLNTPTLNLGFNTKVFFPQHFYDNKNLWLIKIPNMKKEKKYITIESLKKEIYDISENIDNLKHLKKNKISENTNSNVNINNNENSNNVNGDNNDVNKNSNNNEINENTNNLNNDTNPNILTKNNLNDGNNENINEINSNTINHSENTNNLNNENTNNLNNENSNNVNTENINNVNTENSNNVNTENINNVNTENSNKVNTENINNENNENTNNVNTENINNVNTENTNNLNNENINDINNENINNINTENTNNVNNENTNNINNENTNNINNENTNNINNENTNNINNENTNNANTENTNNINIENTNNVNTENINNINNENTNNINNENFDNMKKDNNSNDLKTNIDINNKDINNLNKKEKTLIENFKNKILIQKYLEKPLLFDNKKFDIKIFVLLNQEMDIYICKEGYIKSAKEEYNIKNDSSKIHFCNYKKEDDINKKKIKTEISFEEFQKYMDKTFKKQKKPSINFKKDILTKIKKIILTSMKSIKYLINKNKRKHCFEIFNYTFILSGNFTPYLIKVNTKFEFEENSFMKKIINRIYDDLFKLTIDKLYIPYFKYQNDDEYPFSLKNYDNNENIWERIGNIKY